MQRTETPKRHKPMLYSTDDQKVCEALKSKIQNHIWAFGFEKGPQREGMFDKPATLAFAIFEQPLLEKLPWQKIKVSSKNLKHKNEVHDVLKAAIQSLDERNPDYFNTALEQLDRECSRDFATTFGSSSSKSRRSIYSLVKETDEFLRKVCPECYPQQPGISNRR